MTTFELFQKEYAEVTWWWFLFTFIISAIPMIIKKYRNSPASELQAYNILINGVLGSMSFPSFFFRSGNYNFFIAFIIAFGIGYSLLYFRKENKTENDMVVSVISFFFYFLLSIFLII